MLLRWVPLWLGTAAVGAVVAGAVVAGLAGGDARIAAGVGAAAVALPLLLGGLAARGHHEAVGRAFRSAAGLQTVAVVAALVFAPAIVAAGVRDHGVWPLRLAGANGDAVIAPANDAATVVAAFIHADSAAPPTTTVAATTPTAPTPTTPKEVFAARADSVVVVHVRQAAPEPIGSLLGLKEVEGHGSGFVVDGGLIVTNHHVAGDASSIRVRLKDGRTFDTVRIVLADPQNDLCVLAVDGELKVPPVPLAKASPAVGDHVNVIGSPLGLDHTLTTGLVSALRDQSTTKMVQIDAVVAPGSSGGPVFSATGEVIGVATAMQGQGLNMAVAVEHVKAALSAPRTEKAMAAWTPGFEFKAIDTEGGALLPTARSNLLGVLPHLVESLEGCVTGRPAGVLTAQVSGMGVEVVAANDAVSACVGEHTTMFRMLPMMLLQDSGGVTKVTARYEASDGRVTVLELAPTPSK
jgi:S1-C subfamily serine protease